MPHITLEYSENLIEMNQIGDLLSAFNSELGSMEQFNQSEIKCRAYSSKHFYIGDGISRIFAHVTLSIMPGRSLEVQQEAAKRLLKLMQEKLSSSFNTHECDLTIEVKEIRQETYYKASSFKEV